MSTATASLAAALSAKERRPHSRDFDALVRAIGECKSKAEEDAIVAAEVGVLKPRLGGGALAGGGAAGDKRAMREALIRLAYVEMLGHDASWGHVRALQACSDPDVLTKKVAYLTSTLFLDHRSDLIILIINTLARDLASDNILVVTAALSAATRLVGADTVSAVLPGVTKLLTHPREGVRKKAVLALHAFLRLDPGLEGPLAGSGIERALRAALCDRDPAVMGAACLGLSALASSTPDAPARLRNLTPSLVAILRQVLDHRLPRSYEYHRSPAPFLQIRLLKLLAALAAGDSAASGEVYGVVGDALKRAAGSGHTVSHAIVAECVRTAAAIVPHQPLLDASATAVAGFLASPSRNLRYVGIASLARLVRVAPGLGADHQLAVVDCLEDADESLRAVSLDLLSVMACPSNVVAITDRLLAYLADGPAARGEAAARADVAARIGRLAERFAPSAGWFVDTMAAVFEAAGDAAPRSLVHDLLALLADGAGDGDDAADAELRAAAAGRCLAVVGEPEAAARASGRLLTVVAWVLGEYGHLAPPAVNPGGVPAVIEALARAAEAPAATADTPGGEEVRAMLVSAVVKLAGRARLASLPPGGAALLRSAELSRSTEVATRAAEARFLLPALGGGLPAALVEAALPSGDGLAAALGGAAQPQALDPALPALDAYVADALAAGTASPYLSVAEREARGLPAAATSGPSPPHPVIHQVGPVSPVDPDKARLAASLFGGGGGGASEAGIGRHRTSPAKAVPASAAAAPPANPIADLLGGGGGLAAPHAAAVPAADPFAVLEGVGGPAAPSASASVPQSSAAAASRPALDLDALYAAPAAAAAGSVFGSAPGAPSPLSAAMAAPGADLLGGGGSLSASSAQPGTGGGGAGVADLLSGLGLGGGGSGPSSGATPAAPKPGPPKGGDPFADLLS